jgi:hypothetical protein
MIRLPRSHQNESDAREQGIWSGRGAVSPEQIRRPEEAPGQAGRGSTRIGPVRSMLEEAATRAAIAVPAGEPYCSYAGAPVISARVRR